MGKLKCFTALLIFAFALMTTTAFGQTTVYHYGAKEANNVWQGNNFFLNTLNYLPDTGSTNTYIVQTPIVLPPFAYSYTVGQTFWIMAANANSGASTLSINSLPPHAITKNGTVALTGGEIVAGAIFSVTYDGNNFQLASGTGGGGGGGGGSPGGSLGQMQYQGLSSVFSGGAPLNADAFAAGSATGGI